MDKMNQVSVTEFMSKSKVKMYDMAVEMVEKYNRLVDICNDSAERMADLIERHKVYTNALNKDIADKAAKIDLLEKEIEGRKEGYYALKDKMTDLEETLEIRTKENRSLIKANEKLEKESEKWQDLAKMNRDTICDQYGVCEDFKDKIAELEKELADCKVKIKHQKENLDGINKTLEIRTKENERLIAVKNNQDKEIEAHEAENARLSEKIIELKRSFNNLKEEMANRYITVETHNDICKTYEINNESLKNQVEYLKKELEETYRTKEADLKNHNKRDMTLVDELAGKNEKIKGLVQEVEYYKNQERIRTDQLRATESKVEELHGSINRLTLNCRAKNTEIARLTKEHSDIRHELAKRTAELEFNGEDDHGRTGFKKYIEWLIEEEERAVPERFKARLNEEITEIFEEEETEVKGVGRTSSGRYPWGAKVNDIPCGEDSIE